VVLRDLGPHGGQPGLGDRVDEVGVQRAEVRPSATAGAGCREEVPMIPSVSRTLEAAMRYRVRMPRNRYCSTAPGSCRTMSTALSRAHRTPTNAPAAARSMPQRAPRARSPRARRVEMPNVAVAHRKVP